MPAGTAETDPQAITRLLIAWQHGDPRQSRVVEMRYFGGLGMDEIASALGLSRSTVERDWRFARTWLYLRVTGEE